jgi:hypothetical protein
MNLSRKSKAAKLIEEHFQKIQSASPGVNVLVCGREVGRRMVEIYRLLAGEMPQAAGIENGI